MKIKQILSALLVIALTSTGVTVGVNAIESKYDGKHQLKEYFYKFFRFRENRHSE